MPYEETNLFFIETVIPTVDFPEGFITACVPQNCCMCTGDNVKLIITSHGKTWFWMVLIPHAVKLAVDHPIIIFCNTFDSLLFVRDGWVVGIICVDLVFVFALIAEFHSRVAGLHRLSTNLESHHPCVIKLVAVCVFGTAEILVKRYSRRVGEGCRSGSARPGTRKRGSTC